MSLRTFVRDATAEDLETLRNVPDTLSQRTRSVLFIALLERFTYYGVTATFQNYLQNDVALGLGQSKATSINLSFLFFTYTTSVVGGVVADGRLGRYNTMLVSSIFYLAGCVVLASTSFPKALDHGFGLGGFCTAALVLGIGVGGMKPNLASFLADQCPETTLKVLRLKDGEEVIVSHTLSIQYIYSVNYWVINIGSLSGLVTTTVEKYVGFWAAYLIPCCSCFLFLLILLLNRRLYLRSPSPESVLLKAARVCFLGIRSGFNLEAVKKSDANTPDSRVERSDDFINDVIRALRACRMFFLFIPSALCFNQMSTNLVTQAGQMNAHGISNDTLQTINPISVVLLLPLIQRYLYPFMQRQQVAFGPTIRIPIGFGLASVAIAYAAIVQALVYRSAPCYSKPLTCGPPGSNPGPNHINAFMQIPTYAVLALASIFATPAGTELANNMAPSSMKSFMQALYVLLAGAGGSILGITIAQVAKDPGLVYMFSGIAAGTGAFTLLFWVLYGIAKKE